MLQVDFIKDNFSKVIDSLKKRNKDYSSDLKKIIDFNESRKKQQTNLDTLLSKVNTLSKQIGELFKNGKVDEANELKKEVEKIKPEIKLLQELLNSNNKDLQELLCSIPNVPNELVKKGSDENDNEIIFESTFKVNDEKLLEHWELCEKFDIVDFELGNKVTGSGFPVYKGKGATLQRALINYFLDKNTSSGYTEVQPPVLVNEESAFATGQLPDKEGQMYHINNDDLYLIPTAEVPITNFYRNSIINSSDLPIKLTGYTPCFRREAGSYGKDVRGLNRLHQFDKVAIVRIDKPENLKIIKNGGWHFSFLYDVEGIIKKISSFQHTEFDKEEFKNKEIIKQKIKEGKDIFNRNFFFKKVNIDKKFPKFLVDNKDIYKNWIQE